MTLHNIHENNLQNMAVFESDGLSHPEIKQAQPYQVVVKNILPNPLKDLAPEILGCWIMRVCNLIRHTAGASTICSGYL